MPADLRRGAGMASLTAAGRPPGGRRPAGVVNFAVGDTPGKILS
ncbi:MAG: hypothetical protein ACLPN6_27750 [Streptosporangiaceae bacterium]|jgi:hypothetical protein